MVKLNKNHKDMLSAMLKRDQPTQDTFKRKIKIVAKKIDKIQANRAANPTGY